MSGLKEKVIGGFKIAKGKLLNRCSPLEINIHITDRCNLKCTYCYSNFYKRRNPDISKEQILKIVDAFKELGVLEVSLIGGEPFLHPDISEIIDYIKDNGLMCSMVTNGYFLHRHLAAVKRLNMVCVSLDGPREINDITRGNGSFEHAVKALELLKDNNVNRSIRSTLQKNNLAYIEDMMAIAVKFGAILNFGLLFPQSSEDGQVKTISRDTPEDSSYRQALKKIIELKKKYPSRFFNSVANFKNAYNWPAGYTKFFLYNDELKDYPGFKPVPCYGGRTFATVDTDGRLYPCTNLIGYYDAPNVLNTDIKKAWQSIKNHPCKACFYLSSVEKNLVSSLSMDAIWNILRSKGVR